MFDKASVLLTEHDFHTRESAVFWYFLVSLGKKCLHFYLAILSVKSVYKVVSLQCHLRPTSGTC